MLGYFAGALAVFVFLVAIGVIHADAQDFFRKLDDGGSSVTSLKA